MEDSHALVNLDMKETERHAMILTNAKKELTIATIKQSAQTQMEDLLVNASLDMREMVLIAKHRNIRRNRHQSIHQNHQRSIRQNRHRNIHQNHQRSIQQSIPLQKAIRDKRKRQFVLD